MNINLMCPKCEGILTDKFSAEECGIVDATYKFTMECCKCEIDIDITLTCVYEKTDIIPD